MEQKDRIPVFKERLSELMGNMSVTEFSNTLGLSRQTIGFYLNGNRIPDSEVLIQICTKCNVSSDWLLGLSNDPSRDASAVDSLGFSPKAIERLRNCQELPFGDRYILGLNLLLANFSFYSTLRNIADLAEFVEFTQTSDSYSFLSDEDKRKYNVSALTDLMPEYKRHWNDELAEVVLADTIVTVYPELKGKLTVLCGTHNIEYLANKIAQDFQLVVEASVQYDKLKYEGIITKECDMSGNN